MKYLKTYNKLFESSNEDLVRMIEDLLRDFSDDDFNVEVDILDKFDMDTGEFVEGMIDLMVCIDGGYITENERLSKRNLPLVENIQIFISLDEYLVDNGWKLDDIELFSSIIDNNEISQSTKYEADSLSDLIDMIKSMHGYRFHSLDFCYCKPKD